MREPAKDAFKVAKTAAKPTGAKPVTGEAKVATSAGAASRAAPAVSSKPDAAALLARAGASVLETAQLADPEETTRIAGPEAALETAKSAELQRAELARGAHAPERAASQARAHSFDVAAFATRFAARIIDGGSRFSIRLDPPELGRVDVRLDVGADGVAHARLVAERPEALAELSRHARALERELAEAGVELREGGLSFELAGQQGEDARERDHAFTDAPPAPTRSPEPAGPAAAGDALAEIDTAYGFTVLRLGRLDVRV
jgi:flagellar hook-length control protein FliK